MMQIHRTLDPTKILTRQELTAVLSELKRKAARSAGTRQNLIIFRLATCCGLRVSEIAQLQIADVRVEVARPHLRIRRAPPKAANHATFRSGGTPEPWPIWRHGRPAV